MSDETLRPAPGVGPRCDKWRAGVQCYYVEDHAGLHRTASGDLFDSEHAYSVVPDDRIVERLRAERDEALAKLEAAEEVIRNVQKFAHDAWLLTGQEVLQEVLNLLPVMPPPTSTEVREMAETLPEGTLLRTDMLAYADRLADREGTP